jgi:hypothetical protein
VEEAASERRSPRRGQRRAAEVVGAAAIHRARARAQQAGTRVRGSAAQLRQPRRGSAAGHQPCGPAHAGPGRTLSCPDAANWPNAGFFSFLYLKKSKFQKYIVIPRNFKNGPLSLPAWATSLICKKKISNRFSVSAARRHSGGGRGRGRSPPNGRQGGLPPLGRQGPPSI